MLTVIPPKSTGDIYIGAASGHKPAKVITANGIESMHYNRRNEKPSIAITSNNDISTWDTDADIVFNANTGKAYFADKAKETYAQIVVEEPHPIKATCMLDEAGCITTDSSKAKSILYQEVKNGKIVTRQEPIGYYACGTGGGSNKTFRFIDKVLTEEQIKELSNEILQMRTNLEFQKRLINYVNNNHLPPIGY